MKKTILTILLLAFCVSISGAGVTQDKLKVLARKNACVTTNITFWWRAEALDFSSTNSDQCTTGDVVNGADCSNADEIGAALSGGTVGAAAAKMGSNGIDLPSPDDVVYFNDGTITDVITSSEGRVGFWFRYTTFPTGGEIFRLYDDEGNYFKIIATNSDELTFTWQDNYGGDISYETTGNPVAACEQPSWCFIEVAWKPGDNYREILFDGVSKGISSAAIDAFAGSPIDWRWGTSGAASADVHIENPIISSSSTDDLNLCKDIPEYP